jgi:tetratricopeptide (TPR) repeat protein
MFCSAQDAESYYKEGKRKFDSKQYKESVSYFNNAIKVAPDSIKYLFAAGEACMKTGDLQSAYKNFTKIISIDGNYVNAYLKRSLVLSWSDMYYESIKDGNMVIMLTDIDTVRSQALIYNSSSRCSLRDFEGAMQDLKKAIKYDSLNEDIYNQMAIALLGLGDTLGALNSVKKGYYIDTNSLISVTNMGFFLSMYKNYAESIYYFNRTIKFYPEGFYAYNNRGYALMMIGKYDEALADINKSIKINGTNSFAFRNRALVYLKMNKTKKACDDLYKAKELKFTEIYGNEVEKLIKSNCN